MYLIIGRKLLLRVKYAPYYNTWAICPNNLVHTDENFTWDLYTFIFPDDIISSTSSWVLFAPPKTFLR